MIRQYKNWKVRFNIESPFNSITVEGRGVTLSELGSQKRLSLDLGYKGYDFIEVYESGRLELNTPGLFLYPIYYALDGRSITVSNRVSEVMSRGKCYEVKRFTFVRQLMGMPYPEENIFKNLDLLHASSKYVLSKNGKLTYGKSLLSGGNCLKVDDAIDYLMSDIKSLFSDGTPISMLLSGGYDSRYNLAIAEHFSKTYGNKINLYHEFKNKSEFDISKHVADSVGRELVVKSRTEFLPLTRSVFLSQELIDLQSGFYRENLIRWHHYFDWILEHNPQSTIIGFGVEAHKGKYYRKVQDVRLDMITNFGANEDIVKRVAKQLGIKVSVEEQKVFFDDLLVRSLEYESREGQIDHIHYHTYCSNGYGKRCHDLLQNYDISFPFLDHEFLKMVFSLPRDQKEGFNLVTRALERLNPKLNNLDFTSANEKSIEKGQSRTTLRAKESMKKILRSVKRNSGNRKGRLQLTFDELELLDSIVPNSEVTVHLRHLLSGSWQKADYIQLDYLMQAFLFLTYCEEKHEVTFIFN